MKRYRSIQALRAVAALLVVGYHLSDGRFIVGQAGVDVFFVISGFIMAKFGVHESAIEFAIKRVVRIVPLYWFVTFIMCAGSVAGLSYRFTFDATSLVKSLLFIPYYDHTGNIWPLVIPGWTLNLEMLFYAVFLAGLVIGMPLRVAASVLVILVTAGVVLQPEAAPLLLWTLPLLLEFVAGMFIANFWRPVGAVKGLSLIGFSVTGLALSAGLWGYTDANRVIVWGIPAAFLVAGCVALDGAERWPPVLLIKPLELVGDASYSLYLLHGLVIALMHKKFGTSIEANAMILVVCIFVALVSFYGFERPVSLRLNRAYQINR